MKRIKLLLILAEMPNEAFNWIPIAITSRIFPDGLGGFKPESRDSINLLKKEASKYMEENV